MIIHSEHGIDRPWSRNQCSAVRIPGTSTGWVGVIGVPATNFRTEG